uniref:Uncharacterized protein n=1 Tax=Arundo donax TaxID=35708 RepID=A0A0A8Z4Y0_ARUDO
MRSNSCCTWLISLEAGRAV